MNLSNFVQNLGSGIVNSLPGGPVVLGLINAFLPDDKQLLGDATGTQVKGAYESLPPVDRARIAEKKIDLEITQEVEFSKRMESMSKADGQSTRPKIALRMANILMFTIGLFSMVLVYAITTKDADLLKSLNDIWLLFGVLTGTPATILVHYFGVLRKEQHARVGHNGGLAGLVGQFRGKGL